MQEFGGEEIDGFGAAGEDVVDDVVVCGVVFGVCGVVVDPEGGVLDDGGVIGGEVEVFDGEGMDSGVDLEDCGVDAVGDEGGGSGADTESDD